MTRLIGAVMAIALLVSVAPVVAGDSFHALSRLPAGLSPLDDAQLAAVEGGYDFCYDCTIKSDADVDQSNFVDNVLGLILAGDDVDIEQENEAEVEVNQSIN